MSIATFDEVRFMQKLKKKYEQIPEEVIEYRDKQIDEDNKRRKRKGAVADDPERAMKGKHAGGQDIGDISYKTNWQSIFRDKTGITMPINQFYACPVCGTQHCLDFPPERCHVCGCYNPLHVKKFINIRNI